MDPGDWLEKQEDILLNELNDGLISQGEYNDAMRELQREHRDMARDAAERAYDDEMLKW